VTPHYLFNLIQPSCEYQFFEIFGLTRGGNRSKSPDYEADALTTPTSRQNHEAESSLVVSVAD